MRGLSPLPAAPAPLRLRGEYESPARLSPGGPALAFGSAGLCILAFTDGSGAGPVAFDIRADRSGLEVFLNGGRATAFTRCYPPEGPLPLRAQGPRGESPLLCPDIRDIS